MLTSFIKYISLNIHTLKTENFIFIQLVNLVKKIPNLLALNSQAPHQAPQKTRTSYCLNKGKLFGVDSLSSASTVHEIQNSTVGACSHQLYLFQTISLCISLRAHIHNQTQNTLFTGVYLLGITTLCSSKKKKNQDFRIKEASLQTGTHKYSPTCFCLHCLQQSKLADVYYKILLIFENYITIIIYRCICIYSIFNSI